MRYLFATVLLGLFSTPLALAEPSETIIGKNALFCDDDDRVCLRGTLTYRSNPRLLDLRSRVQRATGPGLLKIRLVGENADGHTRRATLEVEIRGHYSEIVNARLVTDHPDVYSWALDSIGFEPGDNG